MGRAILYFLLTLVAVLGQELPSCLTCDDSKTKCELDCIMPRKNTDEDYAWPLVKPETEDIFANCLSLCTEKRSKCTDSDEVTSCTDCVEACAVTFDGAMLSCVQKQSSDTTMTFGENLDACMVDASDIMDTCRSACDPSGADDFLGWTPETEAGIGEVGRTTTLRELRAKYQQMKREGMKAIDEIDGKSSATDGLRDRKSVDGITNDIRAALFGDSDSSKDSLPAADGSSRIAMPQLIRQKI